MTDDKILQELRVMHESESMRQDRTIKRLWILCILLIVLLVGTNFAWIVYENQFEDIIETVQIEADQQADGDSNNYVIGGDYHGYEADSESDENYTEED